MHDRAWHSTRIVCVVTDEHEQQAGTDLDIPLASSSDCFESIVVCVRCDWIEIFHWLRLYETKIALEGKVTYLIKFLLAHIICALIGSVVRP